MDFHILYLNKWPNSFMFKGAQKSETSSFRILEKLKCFESQTILFRGLIKDILEINCCIGKQLPQIGGVNQHRRTEMFETGASG